MTIETTVKKVISKIVTDIDIDNILPGSSLIDDLGADSLTVVELVMAMEESFNLEIDDKEAGTLTTVQDIIDFIKDKILEHRQTSLLSRY